MTGSRLGGALGIIIGLAGLVFVIVTLAQDWQATADAVSSAKGPLLAAGLGAGLVGMTLIGVNWTVIIGRIGGERAPLRSRLHQYFVGQLVKYVPSGVRAGLGRAEMAHRGGLVRPIAYGATIVSLGTTYLAALLTATLVLPVLTVVSVETMPPWAFWALLILPVGLLAINPRVVLKASVLVSKAFDRDLKIPFVPWSAAMLLVVQHIPSWLAICSATFFVSESLGAGMSLGRVTVATCVSWFLGFVVIGLPSGLGVREAVFIALSGSIDPVLAATVALVARLVFVGVDLLGAAVSMGYKLSGKSKPDLD